MPQSTEWVPVEHASGIGEGVWVSRSLMSDMIRLIESAAAGANVMERAEALQERLYPR